jgi:hypothetical protein
MTESNYPAFPKQVRGVVAFGKKCSKTAFPNPTREGCPERARLRAMAYRDRRLSLNDLPVSHVVRCSPCFQDYLRLRRMSVFMRGLQMTAASLVVVAVLLTAVRFVQKYSGGRSEPTISQQQRSESKPDITSPQVPAPVTPLPIKVDLAAFSPTRGDEKERPAKQIHFPPTLLRVTLQMPVGMEPGEYIVQLKDSIGIVYADKRALGRIEDGTTSVQVDLNLATASRGRFTLTIRPPGLSWRGFPVLVE